MTDSSVKFHPVPPNRPALKFHKLRLYDKIHSKAVTTLFGLFLVGGVAFFTRAYFWFKNDLPVLRDEFSRISAVIEEEKAAKAEDFKRSSRPHLD